MSQRRAFTLVELLVVIAIVAVLIGALLPTLASARTGAYQSVSASNLRQLQLANAVYANEHDDRYIAGAARFTEGNLHRWHGTRASTSTPFQAKYAPIASYLEGGATSAAVRTCPAFRPTSEALRDAGAGFELSCGGYGYNNAFVGTDRVRAEGGVWLVRDDTRGARRSGFAQPARTVAFATTAFAADRLIEYSFVEPPYWPDFPGFRPDPSVHFRFGGRASAAWLDGHMTSETRSYTQKSGLYRGDPDALGIGWFSDVSSNELFDAG